MLPTPDPAFRWTDRALGPRAALPAARRGGATPVHHQATGVARRSAWHMTSTRAWAQAAASVGATPDALMRVKQVHGRSVRVLQAGAVGPDAAAARPEADAAVSERAWSGSGGAGRGLRAAADGRRAPRRRRRRPRRVARHRAPGSPARRSRRWRGSSATEPADLIVGDRPEHRRVLLQGRRRTASTRFAAAGATDEQLARWFTRTRPAAAAGPVDRQSRSAARGRRPPTTESSPPACARRPIQTSSTRTVPTACRRGGWRR